MVTSTQIRAARKFIDNQHLCESMAQDLPRGSAGRNHLLLLAIYSNAKANELVSQHSQPVHDKLINIHHIGG